MSHFSFYLDFIVDFVDDLVLSESVRCDFGRSKQTKNFLVKTLNLVQYSIKKHQIFKNKKKHLFISVAFLYSYKEIDLLTILT